MHLVLTANRLFRLFRSLKTELKIVLIVIFVVTSMPILTVVVMANAGLQAISNVMVGVNPVTHMIEVRNAKGDIVETMQASTTWPVTGYVSLEFGADDSPYQKYHTGIDVASPDGKIGSPITPFMDGKVTKADSDPANGSGYGEYVIVDHGHGITSLYGHMSEVDTYVGQDVKPGDLLGKLGSTGYSTGPHVHFETRVSGLPVNPRIFIISNPVLN